MFCRQCGNENPDDARFCAKCGAEQSAPVAPAAPVAAPIPAPAAPIPAYAAAPVAPRSNAGLIVAVAALIVVVIAFAAYLIINNSKTPGDTTTTTSNASTPATGVTGPAAGPAVGSETLKYVTAAANIRNMATAKGANVVGTLRRSEQVKGVMVKGLVAGTYWFKLSDGRGYVSAVNLGDADPGPLPPPTAATRVPVSGASFCQVATSSGNLRIRSGPNGAIIGGMPAGARFQAYDGEHEADGSLWLRIQPVETRYPTGWVSGDYVLC